MISLAPFLGVITGTGKKREIKKGVLSLCLVLLLYVCVGVCGVLWVNCVFFWLVVVWVVNFVVVLILLVLLFFVVGFDLIVGFGC